MANVVYNSWISDLMTGQKAIETELFRSLDLRERGFAIESQEITARLLGGGVRIYEVPVGYRARTREQEGEAARRWTAFACCGRSSAVASCRIVAFYRASS